GTGTDTASITGTSGANYESIVTVGTPSTSVTDNATATTVTLTASPATVNEGGSIVYTATVNNAVAGTPLVVTLDNGQTITIPVGASTANSAASTEQRHEGKAQGTRASSDNINSTSGDDQESITTAGPPY